MKYSFIAPRKKSMIGSELSLALFFFSVSISMVVLAYLFLVFKTDRFKEVHESFADNMSHLDKETRQIEKEIKLIETEVKMSEEISTNNIVIKESIRDLFDLVPDAITLNRAELDKDSLILYGVTPNKDTYEFMLHAPLRSIFHRTYTSFYPIQNGWYNFVSTNYLESENIMEVSE